jgi:hypothetical protein
MRLRVAERFPQFDLHIFGAAEAMIAWLGNNLQSTIVISLDNDLDPLPDSNGHPRDAGTGRDVAAFLLTQPPTCPIVVHSSNYNAALAMEFDLQDAGWSTARVTPHEDLTWIGAQWFPAVRDAIVNQSVGVPPAEKKVSRSM